MQTSEVRPDLVINSLVQRISQLERENAMLEAYIVQLTQDGEGKGNGSDPVSELQQAG